MVSCGLLCGVSSTVLFPLLHRSALPYLRTFSFAFAHSTHRLASAPCLSIHVRLDSQVTIRSRTYAWCAVQRCPSAPHVRAIPGIRSLFPPNPLVPGRAEHRRGSHDPHRKPREEKSREEPTTRMTRDTVQVGREGVRTRKSGDVCIRRTEDQPSCMDAPVGFCQT